MSNPEKTPTKEAKKKGLLKSLGFIAILAAGATFLFGHHDIFTPHDHMPHK